MATASSSGINQVDGQGNVVLQSVQHISVVRGSVLFGSVSSLEFGAVSRFGSVSTSQVKAAVRFG